MNRRYVIQCLAPIMKLKHQEKLIKNMDTFEKQQNNVKIHENLTKFRSYPTYN